jgi:hypothetical protein
MRVAGCTDQCTFHPLQAQQRGVKQAAPTQPDPEDPLGDHYGDYKMVQSTEQTGRTWTRVEALSPSLEGSEVCMCVCGSGEETSVFVCVCVCSPLSCAVLTATTLAMLLPGMTYPHAGWCMYAPAARAGAGAGQALHCSWQGQVCLSHAATAHCDNSGATQEQALCCTVTQPLADAVGVAVDLLMHVPRIHSSPPLHTHTCTHNTASITCAAPTSPCRPCTLCCTAPSMRKHPWRCRRCTGRHVCR